MTRGMEMMGREGGTQEALFYSFSLEEHVPVDHLLRGIDRFLDLSELHQHLAPHYSNTGRPLIDPALMIRMLVIGIASVSVPSGDFAKKCA